MEIRISKRELQRGVNTVNKAVSAKSTMPILECVLFDVTDKIRLMGNDMDIAIECEIEGNVAEQGKIALDSKTLTELVKKLPENEVHIKTDGTTAHIKCEKLKVDIPFKDGDDFPDMPKVAKDTAISISQMALKDLIRQTIFAVSQNDSNKLMTGELFEINGSRLKVVSLDGHRIAIRKIELKDTYDDTKAVIPAKTLNEIVKIMSGDEVRIYFTGSHAIFEFDNTTVVTRLIEGEFFNVSQFDTMSAESTVKINRKEFFESIDRSTLFVSVADKKPIIFDIQGNTLTWSIATVSGSMSEDLEVEKIGTDMKIAFNPHLLLDAVRAIDDEKISLSLISPKAPLSIRNEDYSYIILPVSF